MRNKWEETTPGDTCDTQPFRWSAELARVEKHPLRCSLTSFEHCGEYSPTILNYWR